LPAEPIELHIKCDNRALGRFVRTSEPGSRPGEPRRRDTHQPGWRRLVAERRFSARQRGVAVN